MGRVVFHQGAGTGTAPTGDIDLSAGGAVASGVAAVTLKDQRGTGVEPADVGWRRAVDDDFGTCKAKSSDSLAGVFDRELQGLSVSAPEWSTDIVMT